MVRFRQRLRLWAAAWIVFQAASLCAVVPLNARAARSAGAADRESACQTNAAPAPCPMRAAAGLPCPMHRGTVHDGDQQSRDVCSMRGTCDPPAAAFFALLWNHGVLTHSSATLPDPSERPVAIFTHEDPASLLIAPDSPPPRA